MLNLVAKMERIDPDFYTYHCFHSSNAKSGWNFAGFVNTEFDRLAELQRTEYDLDKRKKVVQELQNILFKENPWIMIVNSDDLQAYNRADFSDPVIPAVGGFEDPFPFFTIKPKGDRKSLRVGYPWSDIKSINPLLVSESTQTRFIDLMYDMLMRLGPGGKPRLWAAEKIVPVDEKTIDVFIRKDLKFHDGKSLTAEDVEFTYEFMKKYKAAYYTSALSSLESADTLDPHKVRFHLKKPYAPFISVTLAMVPLLPRHIWEKMEKPTEYENVPAIGSGPFKFEHWRKGQELKMSRFDDHFKPPYIDELIAILYGTREACYIGLTQKQVDVNMNLIAHQIDELQKYDHIKTVRLPSIACYLLINNCRRKPFDDSKFRLAIAHVIPKSRILDELFYDYGSVGGSVIARANKFWTDPSIKPYPFDLEKAKNLLEEAGYRWNDNGRLCYPAQ
jgi:peptide/nickel transport system substrate-binding protein